MDIQVINMFSVIDNYGTDLTKKNYITNPAIAREDEIKRANDKIQTLTDEYTKKIDDMVAEKEKEILKI